MSSTLYFTKQNDLNLKQIQVTLLFLNQTLNQQEITKKYQPLILLTPQGSINQPNTILHYIAGQQLKGFNGQQGIQVFQWFEHFNVELHPLLRQIYQQITNERPNNKEKYDYSLKELIRELEVINNHLKIKTFMVGDSVTLVDISLATHLQTAFKLLIIEDLRKKLPNLVRWFTYIRSTGPFQTIFGASVLCGKQGHKWWQVKQN